MNMHAEIVYGL